jgi:D-beta-D-heptose 7-phosphate kinase/D-beta-D-heptose 1-phosphate adenosyltransferase
MTIDKHKKINTAINELNSFNFNDNHKIAIIGDVMLDKYIKGSTNRISQEAPVPVVLEESREIRLGGAANVCNNIKQLSNVQIYPISFVGADEPGSELIQLLKNNNINVDYIKKSTKYSTIEKIRIVARNQHIVRVDREQQVSLDHDDIKYTVESLLDINPDIVIIQDYAKGTINDLLMTELSTIKYKIKPKEKEECLFVMDPNPVNKLKYKNYIIDYMKPNMEEACKIIKYPFTSNEHLFDSNNSYQEITNIFKQLYLRTNINNLLVTCGKYGMYQLECGNVINHMDSHIKEVYDVVGAGDTVLSIFSLCLLNNINMKSTLLLSSMGAGIVVGKFGTSIVSFDELHNALKNFNLID